MAAQPAVSHNPEARESGKSRRISTRASALKLAANLARQLGLVATWPNVQTIRLAIECEAEYSAITILQAAELIAQAAKQFTPVDPERYSFQAAAILRRSNIVDRFWFEDALWRYKERYDTLLARLQERSE